MFGKLKKKLKGWFKESSEKVEESAAAPWTIGAHEDKINDATNKVHNSITFFTITPCT